MKESHVTPTEGKTIIYGKGVIGQRWGLQEAKGGGERVLRIPRVRDRLVQQTLRSILEAVFDPDFHPSSYAVI